MNILVSVILPLSLAFIMFTLGLGLTWDDFRRVAERPAAFFIGALNQVILLPVMAYLVVLAFGLTGELAVGLMILAACPGGVTSNLIARLARADVALSLSLTAVISLLGVMTIPVILSFSMAQFMGQDAPDVSILETALKTFAITVVPVLLGILLRSRLSAAETVMGKVAVGLFVLIVVAAVAGNWGLFQTHLTALAPALLTLLALLTLMGFVLPRLMGRTQREAKTISVETGLQNSALGITLAAGLSGGDTISPYALPAAVYGPIMYLIIIPVLLIYRRMD